MCVRLGAVCAGTQSGPHRRTDTGPYSTTHSGSRRLRPGRCRDPPTFDPPLPPLLSVSVVRCTYSRPAPGPDSSADDGAHNGR